jgi:AcrR family transcriptional regulator
LKEIARIEGIGTLYRHFPTREALVDEIYRKRGDQLAEAAVHPAPEFPPIEAVRRWLLLFIDYLANKAEILNSLTRSRDPLCPSLPQVKDGSCAGWLLERAERSGTAVKKVDPLDLLCAFTGVASFLA